jgi:glycerate kinase
MLAMQVQEADWVLTGTERVQGAWNRGPISHLSQLGQDHKTPVIALVTAWDASADTLLFEGLTGVYPIIDRPRTVVQWQRATAGLIEKASFRVGRWMAQWLQHR